MTPGLQSDDTTHAAAGRWADGSNVRFRLGLPQTIGGWEGLTADLLGGACRWIFPWGNNSNQLQFAFGTHATLEVWVGGGLYDITPVGLLPGEIDGTGQAGYGTGPYGVGGYATPSTDDYFPRTWSGGAYGQDLIASPRLGTIYRWDADDTGVPAVAVTNAPAEVTYCLVSAQDFVFALGCNEQVSGDFNATLVRHHSIDDITDWTTSTTNSSRQYQLPGGGRIVAGRVMADCVLVWTNSALFRFDYLGQVTGVYRFTQVGQGCGLIGPGAAKVTGQTAYWISPDRQFWSYSLGGEPQILPCPIREDFADNLALAQSDKIVASSVSEHGEVWWDYPDSRDGYENSRYIAVPVSGFDVGAWFRGQMARTARVDAGPSPYPLAVQPAFSSGDEGVVYAENDTFSIDVGPTIDLGVSSDGEWVGGYIRRLHLSILDIDFTDPSGLDITYTRTGAATALTSAGVLVHFAADEMRTTTRGTLIEAGSTNQWTWSQDFDNAAWLKSGVTVTADTSAAPDGTTTADLINDPDGVDNFLYRIDTVANDEATHPISVFFKQGTAAETRFDAVLSGGSQVFSTNVITWATGALTGTDPGTLEDIGDGWFRLSMVLTNNASGNTTLTTALRPAGLTAANTGSVYAWGAQWELASEVTSYIPTTTVAVARGDDVLMIDAAVGQIYWHERGQSADGAVLPWFIESADQYMSEEQAMMMRSFWPDAKYQVGPMTLTLTTRYRLRGDETVKTYTISPTAEKVDVRASGRLFHIKLSGSSSPAAFRLGRAVMDTTPLGTR